MMVKEWHEAAMPPGVTGFTDPGGYGDAPEGPPSAAASVGWRRGSFGGIVVLAARGCSPGAPAAS